MKGNVSCNSLYPAKNVRPWRLLFIVYCLSSLCEAWILYTSDNRRSHEYFAKQQIL